MLQPKERIYVKKKIFASHLTLVFTLIYIDYIYDHNDDDDGPDGSLFLDFLIFFHNDDDSRMEHFETLFVYLFLLLLFSFSFSFTNYYYYL